MAIISLNEEQRSNWLGQNCTGLLYIKYISTSVHHRTDTSIHSENFPVAEKDT